MVTVHPPAAFCTNEQVANDVNFSARTITIQNTSQADAHQVAVRNPINQQCVPDLYAASGATQWGNHNYPWLIGSDKTLWFLAYHCSRF